MRKKLVLVFSLLSLLTVFTPSVPKAEANAATTLGIIGTSLGGAALGLGLWNTYRMSRWGGGGFGGGFGGGYYPAAYGGGWGGGYYPVSTYTYGGFGGGYNPCGYSYCGVGYSGYYPNYYGGGYGGGYYGYGW